MNACQKYRSSCEIIVKWFGSKKERKTKMKFLLLAIFVACSQAELEKVDPFLTGGAVAVAGEFPSAVFIRSPGTPSQPLCGGTIIDNQHVRHFSTSSLIEDSETFDFRFLQVLSVFLTLKTSSSILSGTQSQLVTWISSILQAAELFELSRESSFIPTSIRRRGTSKL